MIRLSEALEAEIRAHAARDYPYECCGVLLGRVDAGEKIAESVRAIVNSHEEGHERRFRISPQVMFQLDREERAGGPKTLGFYHSHPDHPARPSQYDKDYAAPWYSYLIVGSRSGGTSDLTSWVLDELRDGFGAERILPWTDERAAQYESVISRLSSDDRRRCFPIEPPA